MAKQKAVVYRRVSSEQQADDKKTSLPEQERVCREYAERQGWEVIHVYSDEGISGETIEERPAVRNLLIEAAGGKFDVVVCQNQDRLGRGEFEKIGGILKAAGVKFATPNGVLDLQMPADRFTFNIFAAVAEYEKERIRERMLGARIARAHRGEFAFPTDPYGFRWDAETGLPVPDEDELPNVLEMYRLASEQRLSYREIAEVLTARRVPCRTQVRYERAKRAGQVTKIIPGKWCDSTVKQILTSRCYLGEWQVWPMGGRSPNTKTLIARLGLAGDLTRRLAKDGPAAVITEATWQAAQLARADHRRKRSGQTPVRQFLLSGGFVHCECGSTMTAREPRPGCRYYGCNRALRSRTSERCKVGYVSAAKLDARVWEKVEELVRDPDAMQALANRTEREQGPRWRRELKGTLQELDGLKFEETLAMTAYRKGVDPLDRYAEHMKELDGRREQLVGEKARLEALLANTKGPAGASDRLGKVAELYRDKLPTLDLEGRRRVLRQLEVEVTVSEGGKVLVEWLGSAFLGDVSGVTPINATTCPTT